MEGREPPVDLLGPHRQVRAAPAIRTAVAAIVGALLLCSCTAEDGRRADDPTAGTRSVDSTGPASPGSDRAAVPPREGACYRLSFDEATAPTNARPSVPCAEPHTAQTFYVGRLDTVVDGHLLAVDSDLAQRQIQQTCPRQLGRFLGGSPRIRSLARLKAVWFSPTIAESDQGASWFRCDVVALDRGSTLAPLPAPRRLRGLLDRPGALDEVGLCGTAAPGARGFERVICARPHAWKALTTIGLAGGSTYPGEAAVRRAGEDRCRTHVRGVSRSPDRFRFGWEWPTRAQWRAGQRFGYCWAPD